jgi:hypothetical protein
MIIYANSRQSGKTTRAIRMASSTGSVLLVPNKAMASYTKRYADELGYPVEIITYKDLQKNIRYGGKFLKGTKVVIDELDMVLRELFGVDVIMATTTGTNLDGELYEGYTELRNISKYLSKIFSKYLSKIF